ncbi:MBL fold metallo-hydrolase [Algoriphagus namhaensis]|uniref:MBL fold metallo-hydrolase n=1 Tax=Algoriphagus namhaensis TaxID=915353 RepID=A0ABV8AQD1_9BACT
MKVKVWGCRGSLPSPGPENIVYGGNTSCVQIIKDDLCVILDGGSGIQRLGKIIGPEVKEIHILLTHLHIDHTMGLGFFQPLYNPNVKVHFWGPAGSVEPLLFRLRRYFSPPLFPVRLNELANHPEIHEIGNSEFSIGSLNFKSGYICHAGPTLGFRVMDEHGTFVYMPDHEPALGSVDFPNSPEWTSGFDLAQGADLLFHDGEYTQEEYRTKVGWGHSSMEDAISFGQICHVKKLAVFHHDPLNSDAKLEQIFSETIEKVQPNYKVILCKEGDIYNVG